MGDEVAERLVNATRPPHSPFLSIKMQKGTGEEKGGKEASGVPRAGEAGRDGATKKEAQDKGRRRGDVEEGRGRGCF